MSNEGMHPTAAKDAAAGDARSVRQRRTSRDTRPQAGAGRTARRGEDSRWGWTASQPSWGKLPLRKQHLDDDQPPDPAIGAAGRGRWGGGECRLGQRCEGWWVQQSTGLLELPARGVAPEAVIAHLDTTRWQHVLEKAADELQGRQAEAAQFLGAAVPVAKGHLAVFDSAPGGCWRWRCGTGSGPGNRAPGGRSRLVYNLLPRIFSRRGAASATAAWLSAGQHTAWRGR